MRIIFMGNSEFAVPSLERIAQTDHQLLYVVSNPPKQQGRGKKYKDTAVGVAAKAMDIPVLQPNILSDIYFLRYIASMQTDIFVVVAYRILPDRLLSIPKYGAINLHPSSLPKYRGAAPIQWALLNGDSRTAVTTIALNNKIDSGAILMQNTIEIKDQDDFGSLSERLSIEGAKLVVNTLNRIEKGTVQYNKQNNKNATQARKIKAEDLIIDWNKPAYEIQNQIRAFSPYPGAYSMLNGKRIKIYSTKVINNIIDTDKIGVITEVLNDKLTVQTGVGQLNITEIQIEGKQRMDVGSFLNGVRVDLNSKFGD